MMWTVGFALAVLPNASGPENVLLIVGDDVGVDRIAVYAEHPDPGSTPRIDALARRGVLFRNAWATPWCSPTRAAILTGRYGFRTGFGAIVTPDDLDGQGQGGGTDGAADAKISLPLSELLIPEALRGAERPWSSAALGKWHLATETEAPLHPLQSGFGHYAGSPFNLQVDLGPGAGVFGYFHWWKNWDGGLAPTTNYATTDTTDDAIRAVRVLPEPWFLYVAFNAAHKPYHAPPDHLHDQDLSGNAGKPDLHRAMVQAMDTEIGRLLDGFDPAVLARTTVIFVGDNGTQGGATEPPFLAAHAKSTLYEGGVNVPLIVAGPRVAEPGTECAGLVHAVDLFATVLDVAGVDPRDVLPRDRVLDSVSLLPYLQDPAIASLRSSVYSEYFAPNGPGPYARHERAIRGPRFKLVLLHRSPPELYDLRADPFEQQNLLDGDLTEQQAEAHARLLRELERLTGG